jgi:protein O-GlcNAc transferase
MTAFRPAPIQVSFLVYPGTSGAPFVDYLVADTIVVPPEHSQFYSEKLVYMPWSYQVRSPCHSRQTP